MNIIINNDGTCNISSDIYSEITKKAEKILLLVSKLNRVLSDLDCNIDIIDCSITAESLEYCLHECITSDLSFSNNNDALSYIKKQDTSMEYAIECCINNLYSIGDLNTQIIAESLKECTLKNSIDHDVISDLSSCRNDLLNYLESLHEDSIIDSYHIYKLCLDDSSLEITLNI